METQRQVESKPGAVHLPHIQTEGATAAGQLAAALDCHVRLSGKQSMSRVPPPALVRSVAVGREAQAPS